jgi:hypothetical protein
MRMGGREEVLERGREGGRQGGEERGTGEERGSGEPGWGEPEGGGKEGGWEGGRERGRVGGSEGEREREKGCEGGSSMKISGSRKIFLGSCIIDFDDVPSLIYGAKLESQYVIKVIRVFEKEDEF